MSTLAELIARVQVMMMNSLTSDYPAADVTEALRQALHEYNVALPLDKETVITLPGDGREIALDALDDLHRVTEVYWPYDSTDEIWLPNRVRGYYLYFDDARPVLYLNNIVGDEPQLNDELRLWYTTDHTIENLDSGDATTLPTDHESLIVQGAGGLCALHRTIFLTEFTSADLFAAGLLATWGNAQIKGFRARLADLRKGSARSGQNRPFGGGWQLDKWDEG